MYTFDLFRDDRFMVCLGKFYTQHHCEAEAFELFTKHSAKPENAGVRWQVRQLILDSEGELDHTVLIKEWIAA